MQDRLAGREEERTCKRVSGFYEESILKMDVRESKGTYVEDAINPTELLHAHHEDCEASTCAYVTGEDVKEARLDYRYSGVHWGSIGRVGRVSDAVDFHGNSIPVLLVLGLFALCMTNFQDVPCCRCFGLTTTKGQPSRRRNKPND